MDEQKIRKALRNLGFSNYLLIAQAHGTPIRQRTGRFGSANYKEGSVPRAPSFFVILEEGRNQLLSDLPGKSESLKAAKSLTKGIAGLKAANVEG